WRRLRGRALPLRADGLEALASHERVEMGAHELGGLPSVRQLEQRLLAIGVERPRAFGDQGSHVASGAQAREPSARDGPGDSRSGTPALTERDAIQPLVESLAELLEHRS